MVYSKVAPPPEHPATFTPPGDLAALFLKSDHSNAFHPLQAAKHQFLHQIAKQDLVAISLRSYRDAQHSRHIPSLTWELILGSAPPRYKPVLKHVENPMRLLPKEMPFSSQAGLDTMLQDVILPVRESLDPLLVSEHADPAATRRRCLSHN